MSLSAKYNKFHKVGPDKVIERSKTWVPGDLVLLGRGVDVGYGIVDHASSKDGRYVHDFGRGVKVYRRARAGERADVTWRNFPSELMMLGDCIGFTYEDDEDVKHEVSGSTRKKLATNSAGRMLVIVGPKGVEHVFKGGNMRVTDWIYD